jgi:GNAT superfamily N-acetyltransferase
VTLRAATDEDVQFLTDMVVAACNWSGEQRVTRAQVATDPELSHYVAGWRRPDDVGVIAVDTADQPVGAAWSRVFSADEPGYGFVASDVPEISMAILLSWRGQGVGRRLLTALVEQVRKQGRHGVSLSVEDGNPAVRLYRAAGFVPVGRNGGSITMLLDLTTR